MTATPLAMQSFYNQNKNSVSNSPFGGGSGHRSSSAGSPYLPGYLLGNSTPATGNYGRPVSSSGYQRSSSYSKLNSRSPPRSSLGSPYTPPTEHRQQRLSPLSNQQLAGLKGKPGAPPTESLYGSSTQDISDPDTPMRKPFDYFSQTPNETYFTPQKSLDAEGFNASVFSPRKDEIPQSPAQVDPFFTEGSNITSSDVLDHTAVTVFGFPPAASSYILQQFSQYGTVEKHEIHNTGNWLHLKYQTKIQAKKALSKNGKIFARSIMVGVLPCVRKEIAGMEAELDVTAELQHTPKQTLRKASNMRPLSTSNMRNVTSTSDVFSSKGTPQKKDSVVTKALDYVFGW